MSGRWCAARSSQSPCGRRSCCLAAPPTPPGPMRSPAGCMVSLIAQRPRPRTEDISRLAARRRRGARAMRRLAAVLPPYAWLALFFLVPFLIVLKISLADQAMGIPPYTPLITGGQIQASGANYQFLLSDSLYARAYLNAIWFAAWS